MRRAWRWWQERCARQEDPLPLALVRVLLATVLLGDLLRTGWLGLVPWLWRPFEAGGISRFRADTWLVLTELSPTWAGPVTWGVAVVAAALVALGVATRPAIVVLLVASAQLGHLFPPGDRAIDRLLRTALLVLLFSGAHRRVALTGSRPGPIGAWAGDLLRFLLVLVYLNAGIFKLTNTLNWVSFDGYAPLYRVLANPMAGRLDPVAAAGWTLPLKLMGMGAIAIELSAPLLFTRWAPWWALLGAAMHLSIAATMELGMFSWGMLAFYPLLFAPWLRAWQARRAGGAGPG